MNKATLVIMAAGIGSRFGGGIKQLEPIGPNGEIIMDYSIHDAKEAGFDKVVFVIRKDLEKDFKEIIGNRIEKQIEVAYAYQEMKDIPKEYQAKFSERKKPWGTGQAILACREVIQGPFLVINADDYYGKEAFVKSFQYLTGENASQDIMQGCMVGFVLKNTLSDNGSVTRGVCKVDEKGMLTSVQETHDINKTPEGAAVEVDGKKTILDKDTIVSMNMWGLQDSIFETLDIKFQQFLENTEATNLKAEYLLPSIIGELLMQGKIAINVLQSNDEWFGITYKEDKAVVVQSINELIDKGIYPRKLFAD